MNEFDMGIAENLLYQINTNYPRRYYKKEKLAFFEFISSILPEYNVRIQKLSSARNIVIGDIDGASTILTAHYDTARRSLINLKMYYDHAARKNFTSFFAALFSALSAVFTTNKTNVNDNTSGILAVIDAVKRCNSAAILFDNEEGGYAGSLAYNKRVKSNRSKLHINIDCIGADHFAVQYNSKTQNDASVIATQLGATCDKMNLQRYSSDGDDLSRAITIASFKKDNKGLRYIDDIHTKYDTKLDTKNIKKVSDAIVMYLNHNGGQAD